MGGTTTAGRGGLATGAAGDGEGETFVLLTDAGCGGLAAGDAAGVPPRTWGITAQRLSQQSAASDSWHKSKSTKKASISCDRICALELCAPWSQRPAGRKSSEQ